MASRKQDKISFAETAALLYARETAHTPSAFITHADECAVDTRTFSDDVYEERGDPSKRALADLETQYTKPDFTLPTEALRKFYPTMTDADIEQSEDFLRLLAGRDFHAKRFPGEPEIVDSLVDFDRSVLESNGVTVGSEILMRQRLKLREMDRDAYQMAKYHFDARQPLVTRYQQELLNEQLLKQSAEKVQAESRRGILEMVRETADNPEIAEQVSSFRDVRSPRKTVKDSDAIRLRGLPNNQRWLREAETADDIWKRAFRQLQQSKVGESVQVFGVLRANREILAQLDAEHRPLVIVEADAKILKEQYEVQKKRMKQFAQQNKEHLIPRKTSKDAYRLRPTAPDAVRQEWEQHEEQLVESLSKLHTGRIALKQARLEPLQPSQRQTPIHPWVLEDMAGRVFATKREADAWVDFNNRAELPDIYKTYEVELTNPGSSATFTKNYKGEALRRLERLRAASQDFVNNTAYNIRMMQGDARVEEIVEMSENEIQKIKSMDTVISQLRYRASAEDRRGKKHDYFAVQWRNRGESGSQMRRIAIFGKDKLDKARTAYGRLKQAGAEVSGTWLSEAEAGEINRHMQLPVADGVLGPQKKQDLWKLEIDGMKYFLHKEDEDLVRAAAITARRRGKEVSWQAVNTNAPPSKLKTVSANKLTVEWEDPATKEKHEYPYTVILGVDDYENSGVIELLKQLREDTPYTTHPVTTPEGRIFTPRDRVDVDALKNEPLARRRYHPNAFHSGDAPPARSQAYYEWSSNQEAKRERERMSERQRKELMNNRIRRIIKNANNPPEVPSTADLTRVSAADERVRLLTTPEKQLSSEDLELASIMAQDELDAKYPVGRIGIGRGPLAKRFPGERSK